MIHQIKKHERSKGDYLWQMKLISEYTTVQ